MIDVDFVAQRYGVLPSTIAKMDVRDFQLDLTVGLIAAEYQQKVREKSPRGVNMIG